MWSVHGLPEKVILINQSALLTGALVSTVLSENTVLYLQTRNDVV